MQIYSLRDMPLIPDARVERKSLIKNAGIWCVFAAVGLGLVVAPAVARVAVGGAPIEGAAAVQGFGVFLSLLFVPLARRIVRAARSPQSWLLIATSEGLFIKYRSFLNHHFSPEDPSIAFLSHREIASVGEAVERSTTPDGDGGTTTYKHRFVEIRLRDRATGERLEAALAVERTREGPYRGRWIRSRTRFRDHPVAVVAPGAVRVEWVAMRRSLGRVLDDLALAYPRHEDASRDWGDWRELSGDALEDYLLRVAQQGRVIDAIAIARKRYDLGLVEARRFVEELTGCSATNPSDPQIAKAANDE